MAGDPLERSAQGVAPVGEDELVEFPAGAVWLPLGEREQLAHHRGEVHDESPLMRREESLSWSG